MRDRNRKDGQHRPKANMADITDQHDQTSPNELDESQSVGNGGGAPESRGTKRQRSSVGDDDDDDEEKGSRERRKIEIKFISDKSRRHITFSKRKAGIMKKVRPCSCPRPNPRLSPFSVSCSPLRLSFSLCLIPPPPQVAVTLLVSDGDEKPTCLDSAHLFTSYNRDCQCRQCRHAAHFCFCFKITRVDLFPCHGYFHSRCVSFFFLPLPLLTPALLH